MDILEIAAYHEAGHVLGGYFAGWRVNCVALDVDGGELRMGRTDYDRGADAQINEAIHLHKERPDLYSALSGEEQRRSLEVVKKRYQTAVAGPIAEATFFPYYRPLDDLYNSFDHARTVSLHDFLEATDQLDEDVVDGWVDEVTAHMGRGEVKKAVSELGKELLKGKNYRLDKKEIEACLQRSGIKF